MTASTTAHRKESAVFRRQPEVKCCVNCHHFVIETVWRPTQCMKLETRLAKADTTAVCKHHRKV
jgi:hypothetical protein